MGSLSVESREPGQALRRFHLRSHLSTASTSSCFFCTADQTASARSPIPFSVTSSRAMAIRMSSSSLIALQPFRRELAFHGQRHQQLLSHQPQTAFLHRLGVMEKLHLHGEPLPNSPASPAGLAKHIDRVSSLVEQDCGKVDEVQPGLHQFRMADHGLHAGAELPIVPSPPAIQAALLSSALRHGCPHLRGCVRACRVTSRFCV